MHWFSYLQSTSFKAQFPLDGQATVMLNAVLHF